MSDRERRLKEFKFIVCPSRELCGEFAANDVLLGRCRGERGLGLEADPRNSAGPSSIGLSLPLRLLLPLLPDT